MVTKQNFRAMFMKSLHQCHNLEPPVIFLCFSIRAFVITLERVCILVSVASKVNDIEAQYG